jgi:hypothetical protein
MKCSSIFLRLCAVAELKSRSYVNHERSEFPAFKTPAKITALFIEVFCLGLRAPIQPKSNQEMSRSNSDAA